MNRAVLTDSCMDECRRPWRREKATDDLKDLADLEFPQTAWVDRQALLELLHQLPPRTVAVEESS